MTGRVSRALASLLALLVLLTACGSGEPAASDAGLDTDGLHGSALDEPYQVPETDLVDTAGADYSLTDADADLTLVFFGYTHCPDICGIVMSTIASALVRLDDADRERVDVVFVTTDPARDDPASLRAYLDSYDPQFEGATGEMETIIATARELRGLRGAGGEAARRRLRGRAQRPDHRARRPGPGHYRVVQGHLRPAARRRHRGAPLPVIRPTRGEPCSTS